MTSAFDLLKQPGLKIGLCSRGLMRVPYLAVFLQSRAPKFKLSKKPDASDLYIGWGNKPSGQLARSLAAQTDKPFLLLEDAFFRSVAPQSVSGEPAIGLVLDDQGIYYDASQPSRLQALISTASTDNSARSQGRSLLAKIAEHRVSKYNNFDLAGNSQFAAITGHNNILVIDQTYRDQSIIGAGADDSSFANMLIAAIDENPGANIIVKLHPEVMAGKKRGYLKDQAEKHGCLLLTANINPWDLFEKCSTVYTVSSQLGFEALVAGKKVRCFGTPFYAGWGLTIDEKSHEVRANFKPDIAQLTHAACIGYARYYNPFDRQLQGPQTAIEQLAFQADLSQKNTKIAAFYKISNWKKQRIRKMFMKPTGERLFYYTRRGAIAAAKSKGGALVAWASKIDADLEAACAQQKIPLHRLEDGFIRSVGLGANLHQPMSLVLDEQGIYYDANQPSTLETILETGKFPPSLIAQAEKLIDTLVKNNISKYNLAADNSNFDFPSDKTIILVPGQVDNDASILQGGGGIDSLELLKRVRKACPNDFIVFKPHPDVMSGQRPGIRDAKDALAYADFFAENAPITTLVSLADEIHTITSLTGFEALQRGKKVACYGMPFYAGWGLTKDRAKCVRRNTKRSLAELVAATLILYPRYFDPDTSLACGPEVVIERIQREIKAPTPPSLIIRLRRLQGKIKRAIIPAKNQ